MLYPAIRLPRSPLFKVVITILLLTSTICKAEDESSFINVIAEGKASAKPDQAELQLTFTSTHLKVDQARSAVDQQVNNLLERLKLFTLGTASLDSSQTQIHPQYDYRNQQKLFIGYQVNRNVSFILNDLQQLEPLIQAITESKLSRLNQIRFGLNNPSLIKEEALADAIQKSRLLAKQIADAYEVKLGKIHRVNHRSAPEHNIMRAMSMNAELASDSAAQTYQQKDLEFKATVEVAFRFD